jgi:shikimate kinase
MTGNKKPAQAGFLFSEDQLIAWLAQSQVRLVPPPVLQRPVRMQQQEREQVQQLVQEREQVLQRVFDRKRPMTVPTGRQEEQSVSFHFLQSTLIRSAFRNIPLR